MPVCLNCGRTVSDNDIYYDVESNKFGCIYCIEDKIKQHSDWCKEWRKQNMAGKRFYEETEERW